MHIICEDGTVKAFDKFKDNRFYHHPGSTAEDMAMYCDTPDILPPDSFFRTHPNEFPIFLTRNAFDPRQWEEKAYGKYLVHIETGILACKMTSRFYTWFDYKHSSFRFSPASGKIWHFRWNCYSSVSDCTDTDTETVRRVLSELYEGAIT